ncbi:MAG: hypothetical protein CVU79_00170 [Elusimicrobia bacterium HGW-Elusimicrobia-3]|nr:MAG: hypothetical protein CVU79_00170 [Elusimicrobia bacterium HGW-Elusimicrobia-3]
MLYLYLDESGDLGFDFVNKKPSAYFTICVLAIHGVENNLALTKAVKSIIRRKLLKARNATLPELKGARTTLEVKTSLYRKVEGIPFALYATTLNKRGAYDRLSEDKERIYNYIARLTLEQVGFENSGVRVIITVDRSKSRLEIERFNSYIVTQLKAILNPRVPLEIYHIPSEQSAPLQAADIFAWGISRKYERGDTEWYEVFKPKVRLDCIFDG